MKSKTNKILFCFLFFFFAVYIFAVVRCFVELPIDRPTWNIRLILYFHGIPMFFFQLLLCRLAKPCYRVLTPVILLAVVGCIFLSTVDWDAPGWLFFLIWSIFYVGGCAFAWIVWGVGKKIKNRQNGENAKNKM